MSKRVAVLNDPTNMGGYVITASGTGFNGIDGVALLGDLASCAKCNSYGKIIEGAYSFIIDGKPVAYDGCIIACKCSPVGHHKIIAVKSHMYVNVSTENLGIKSISPQPKALQHTPSVSATSQTNSQQSPLVADLNSLSNNDKDLIRVDAYRLLKCADELCEKHLYHDDIKQGFKKEVKNFANYVINQVDTGAITYEQGAEKIKEEEDNLWEQSFEWLSRGLSIFGGAGMMMAGAAMCTTGVGCLIGAYIGAHGANSIQEGVFGGDGFLKSTYQDTAKQLGLSESFGSLVYDSIDLTLSFKGKLKLVPKINDAFQVNKFNPYNKSTVFKLWQYGRQDFVRAYKQMSNIGLKAEIYSDLDSMGKVLKDVKNVMLADGVKKEAALIIREPEKIKNVSQLIETCEYVMLLTFEDNPAHTGYYRCTKPSGEVHEFYENNTQIR